MLTFFEWFEKNFPEEKIPEGEINGIWFGEHGLPMIVACTSCGMTMTLFSAMVDEDTNEIYCSECSDC